MHSKHNFATCFYFLLLFLFISCKDIKCDKIINKKIDAVVQLDEYEQILSKHKNDKLTDKELMLGFSIGMSSQEIQNNVDVLVKNGRLFTPDEKIYALIPTLIDSHEDINGSHQLIAELNFHLNKDSSLRGMYAHLYGPRFLVKPNNSEDISERNNQIRMLNVVLYETIIENFETKYGIGKVINKYGSKSYIWPRGGKIVHLDLEDPDLSLIGNFYRNYPPSNRVDFSKLVRIGSLYYTSVERAIQVNEGANRIIEATKPTNGYDNYQKVKREEAEKALKRETVNKTGI